MHYFVGKPGILALMWMLYKLYALTSFLTIHIAPTHPDDIAPPAGCVPPYQLDCSGIAQRM